MTVLSFEDDGIDVIYEGIEFRLDRALVEEATGRPYPQVTDHEVLKIVDPNPQITGEPRRIGDII